LVDIAVKESLGRNMALAGRTTKPKPRNVLKVARREVRDVRRGQLIEAAIKAIARHGIGETTIIDVVKIAGMANGSVNQYFDSKDALLLSALERVTGEFRETWERAAERSGDDPSRRLEALLMAQFAPHVCTLERIGVWVAYWSEVRFRPKYMAACADSDAQFFDEVAAACKSLTRIGRYSNLDWRRVSRFLAAASDGLWIDILLGTVTREMAIDLMRAQLAAVFTRHFAQPG
jgi:TetR/AcrR family transcriptional repressor of bet genes